MAVIIIPARYASSRFPGKPLFQLRARDGTRKPLIQWSWETAKAVRGVDAVYVATDDERIAEAAEKFGAQVLMTSSSARNGTERCAEALACLSVVPEIVVNLQGDAPLTPSWFVEELIKSMQLDPAVSVATPVLRCDVLTYANFVTDRLNGRIGGTTAVFDRKMRALYFSKEVIPYLSAPPVDGQFMPVYHHVGVYAYRPQALYDYVKFTEGTLENLEGLEQLRFMENGIDIRCVEVEARGKVFWELNNPIDVERIEAVL